MGILPCLFLLFLIPQMCVSSGRAQKCLRPALGTASPYACPSSAVSDNCWQASCWETEPSDTCVSFPNVPQRETSTQSADAIVNPSGSPSRAVVSFSLISHTQQCSMHYSHSSLTLPWLSPVSPRLSLTPGSRCPIRTSTL